MAKTKQWETKNRIYTTYRGKTTYIVKPKVKEEIGDFTTVATGRIPNSVSNQGYPEPVKKEYVTDVPYNYPTCHELDELIHKVENRINDAYVATKKEGTRQDLELVRHHLKIARRYAFKAMTI